MSLVFYPHDEDIDKGGIEKRLDVLLEAAERYKAAVLDLNTNMQSMQKKLVSIPRDLSIAFNWNEIAALLREVRELSEGTKGDQQHKAKLLFKLAEIYEVLRASKMPKLEAVRLALISESNQLGGIQVA